MLQWHLNLAWTLHIWFCSLILCESDLLVDLMSRSQITYISLSFEHQIACNESWLYHSIFYSWLTSEFCSWYQAKQWVNMFLNQYNHSSLICIVLSFKLFWTASNDICILHMHWINLSILKSVLQNLSAALCLKCLKCLMLYLLLFF